MKCLENKGLAVGNSVPVGRLNEIPPSPEQTGDGRDEYVSG